jgi:hypothetical protein
MLQIIEKLFLPVLLMATSIGLPFYLENRKLKKENSKLTIKVKDQSIFVQFIFKTSNESFEICKQILKNTKASRVHLFTASNGKSDLKYCNSLFGFELVNDRIEVSCDTYKALEFDNAYNIMLKNSETSKKVVLDVAKMQDCLLKNIYNSIRIKHSIVVFSFRCSIDNENDRIFYLSIATKLDEPFSSDEEIYIKQKTDELKYVLKNIMNLNNQ